MAGATRVKLLPSRRKFCVHPYNHAPDYSVTSFEATYRRRHVCLAETCHFWQNGWIFYVLLR